MPREVIFGIGIIILVFLFLSIWLLFFLVYYQKKKRNFIEDQQKMEENYKQELNRVHHEIQEETIRQIGYELHDNIGQLITVAKIHLTNLIRIKEEPQLLEINRVVSKSLDELRRLSKSLDTSSIEQMSLHELIEKDQNRINQLGHVKFVTEIEGEEVEIDSKKKIILYRMIQEIVTNALKHAQCDLIRLRIIYGNDFIRYRISDNGKGFDAKLLESSESQGSGLRHLKTRATLLGGNLILITNETGTHYEVVCPKSSLCNIK